MAGGWRFGTMWKFRHASGRSGHSEVGDGCKWCLLQHSGECGGSKGIYTKKVKAVGKHAGANVKD